jgi:hypothetical protein
MVFTMTLEKKLAEIQVISNDLANRKTENDQDMIYEYLEGISHEAGVLYDSYVAAKKRIKGKNLSESNRYVGEFVVSAKNLADNLNYLIQSLYGTGGSDLRKLEGNAEKAPKTKTGDSLVDVFTKVHSPTSASSLISARNKKSHGRGHTLVKVRHASKSRYSIDGMDSLAWLREHAKKYLNMAKECMDTISKSDNDNFRNKENRQGILSTRLKNFEERTRPTRFSTYLLSLMFASLVGTSVMTSSFVKRVKNDALKLNKASFVIERDANFVKIKDNWESSALEDFREEILEERARSYIKHCYTNGIDIDNYLDVNHPIVREVLSDSTFMAEITSPK